MARCSALVLLPASILPQAVLASPEIEHWRDPSGAMVYYVNEHQIPMVDILLQFDAGHARSEGQQGIAGLTSALLDQGAGGMSQEEVIDLFMDAGARFNAGADDDKASVSLRSLIDPGVFSGALDLFVTVVSRPDFPARNFKLAKRSHLAYIKARKQNIADVRDVVFDQAIYPDHVYGVPGAGTYETVSSITRDDVIRFYRKYYVSNNLNIVIVGDIDRARAKEAARKIGGSLNAGASPPPVPPVPVLREGALLKVGFPSQQAHVVIGQPLIKIGHPDFYALYLGNHILGGSGFGSRLLDEIRVKRGLAYSSYSSFSTRREAGPFSISFQTRVDQADQALDVAMNVLTDFMKNGPAEEELELARASILGSLPLRFASNSSILNAVARITYYGLPLDHMDQFKPRIKAVTREDVIAAFRRHIHSDRMVTVVVGGKK